MGFDSAGSIDPATGLRHHRSGSKVGIGNNRDSFQEAGGKEPIHDLKQTLENADSHRAVWNFPDGRGIRAALLSKLGLTNPLDLVGFPPGTPLGKDCQVDEPEPTEAQKVLDTANPLAAL